MKISKTNWKQLQRRQFGKLAALYASGLFAGGWLWTAAEEDDGLPWPFRRILKWNEKVGRVLYRQKALGETPQVEPERSFRVNGRIGLDSNVDLNEWTLQVEDRKFSLADLKALPQTSESTVFKCVEGWSEPVAYSGVRFSDFLSVLGTNRNPSDFGAYVYLETPDQEYYVSIDMDSMLHPKTVLALEMNGAPLTPQNGAPVRLMIPVKYGIKNIKRIARIEFHESRPADYWAELGYDWYAGL